MKKITTTDRYYTPYQLKLPLEISKKIKISDPVYTFCEVFDHIDLNKHLVVYGSFNNYLYCEKHGMEKYMKFTMFEKESKDEKYRDNPYRAVNFPISENGKPVCPNGKEFNFLYITSHE